MPNYLEDSCEALRVPGEEGRPSPGSKIWWEVDTFLYLEKALQVAFMLWLQMGKLRKDLKRNSEG